MEKVNGEEENEISELKKKEVKEEKLFKEHLLNMKREAQFKKFKA